MPVLHIFRGLPGSGKSTAARKLAAETGAILIEPDMLLVRDGEYRWSPFMFSEAIYHAQKILSLASFMGADIIYADVLPTKKDVCEIELNLDDSYSYHTKVHDLKITPEESKLRNRHNVRPEDIDRMAKDWEDWE